MKNELLKNAAQDFYSSNSSAVEEAFPVPGSPGEFIIVKIERKKLVVTNESFRVKASNTISAYPSGSTCPRCNGSGVA